MCSDFSELIQPISTGCSYSSCFHAALNPGGEQYWLLPFLSLLPMNRGKEGRNSSAQPLGSRAECCHCSSPPFLGLQRGRVHCQAMTSNLEPQSSQDSCSSSLRLIQDGLELPAGPKHPPTPCYWSGWLGSIDPLLHHINSCTGQEVSGHGAQPNPRLLCHSLQLAPWLHSLPDLLASQPGLS